jgi:hypothetical protein
MARPGLIQTGQRLFRNIKNIRKANATSGFFAATALKLRWRFSLLQRGKSLQPF